LLLSTAKAFEGGDRGLWNAFNLQVLREDGDIVFEALQVLALDGGDAFQHFAGIEYRLGCGERVGGFGGRLTLDKGEAVGADAEALEQCAGDVEVDFIAACMDATDLVDHLGASRFHFVANLGHGRRVRRRRLFAGFGHDQTA